MNLQENWSDAKKLFRESFKSSFHYALATVGEEGEPHVTPIGSLILGKPGIGFYFEKFPRRLPKNLSTNNQICVLAVNSSRWFWLKALIGGRFGNPPAVRLYGEASELRPATELEIALWQKRVRRVRFSKGHALIWREMSMVREIRFTRIEPVQIGRMTQGLWRARER